MPARNSIGDEGNSQLVVRSPPTIQPPIRANFNGLVHLSVCKAFILAFIPAQPAKSADCLVDLLLRVQAKTILNAALLAVRRDVRLWIYSGKKRLYRLPIAPHVGMIDKAEQPDCRLLFLVQLRPELQLDIF